MDSGRTVHWETAPTASVEKGRWGPNTGSSRPHSRPRSPKLLARALEDSSVPEQVPRTGLLLRFLSFLHGYWVVLDFLNPEKVMVVVMTTEALKGWFWRLTHHPWCSGPIGDTPDVG